MQVFTNKIGGAKTKGKPYPSIMESSPEFGALNVPNLVLVIAVLDQTLGAHRVLMDKTLLKDMAVGIFHAMHMQFEKSGNLHLYSMGRASGGEELGDAYAHILAKLVALMNHSYDVAKKHYWDRPRCVLVVNGVRYKIPHRPAPNTINMEDIYLPCDPARAEILRNFASRLRSQDPAIAQYLDRVVDQRATPLLTKAQRLQALTMLITRTADVILTDVAGCNISARANPVFAALADGLNRRELQATENGFHPIDWTFYHEQWRMERKYFDGGTVPSIV